MMDHKKSEKMAKNVNDCGAIDFNNITLMTATPRPQACSTVQRKDSKHSYRGDAFKNYRDSALNYSDKNEFDDDNSSLGILDNMSSRSVLGDEFVDHRPTKIEINRQLAREILKKVSDDKSFSFSHEINDKENNANSHNMTISNTLFDTNDNSSQKTLTESTNQVIINNTTLASSAAAAAEATINFTNDNLTFNSAGATAEIMSKFSNEEFLSGSRLLSQLDADQQSYINNYNAMPLLEKTEEKDKMEFSCFSGIMGEVDLSVESCAGRRISVGEFFKRKCDTIGQLNDVKANDVRPTFGFEITSPKRPTRNTPLVNLTTMSDMVSSSINKSYASTTMDCTRDQDQEDVISLSRIARELENTSGTPRNLVDQLLMLKKIQKEQKYSRNYYASSISNDNNTVGNTYTIASKLDNIKLNASFHNNNSSIIKNLNPFENNTVLVDNIKTSESMKKQNNNSTPEGDKKYLKISKKEIESPPPPAIKPEINKFNNSLTINDKLIIGRNVEGLYRCIVGVAKDVDIEMLNESDRWLMCTCNVFSIQGDQANVELNVPKFTMIIEPSKSQTVKVKVKMIKRGNPVMAALSISVQDMTTRDEFTKSHMMCFIPEEPKIQLIQPLTNELNFNDSKIYTIKLSNKFDSAVPIECFITNDERRQFTIDIKNKLIDKTYSQGNDTIYVFMIPLSDEFSINVQLNHRLSNNNLHDDDDDNTPIFIIRLHTDLQNGTIIKQYLLRVDDLFSKKTEIQLFDTELPIILSSKESKKLKIKNIKNKLLILAASVLISKDSHRLDENYSIEPKKVKLEADATIEFTITILKDYTTINTDSHAIIRIKSDEYSYWYPISLMTNENSMSTRCCYTPQQQQQAMSLPSSSSPPHSTVSNKSSKSSVSGLTVAGETIPIQATHSSLSWISIRVGKYEIKEFTIRNTSQNRIKLQATIIDNDKSFKFLKDRESSVSITLVLQKMESKTLTIIFSPNSIGPAVGKITFKHYEAAVKKQSEAGRCPSRLISLYGYGGYARVSINKALKIMANQMWLSLGKFNNNNNTTLSTRIELENTGDLSAYAKINLSPKAVYPGMETSWNIEPTEVILGPRQSRWIKIDFRPKKDDLMLVMRGDVADMAVLTITHGDEPTRWRIRRLYKKLITNNAARQMNDDVFRDVVRPICKELPGETTASMHNLIIIRDKLSELGVLCRGVNRYVITLIMELNTDDITLSMLNDEANESQTFQSLCSDTSHNYTFQAANEDSYMPYDNNLE